MTITIGVSQVATAAGSSTIRATLPVRPQLSDNAAIRLLSNNLSPISVEFAETGNEIG